MRRTVLILTLLVARALAAQSITNTGPAFGTIDGLVSDTALAPLAGASITILSTGVRVETGASGRFRILQIRAGQYVVIVRHLGHRPASGVIEVPANDTTRLSYTLEPTDVVALEAMVVTEQRLSATLLDFEQRRRTGQGTYLTQADIDRRNSVFTTELLRGIPSIALLPTNSGGMSTYAVVSTRLGSCRSELFVDGVRLPRQANTDDLPPPREIAGIEVYAGPATIPPQFAGGRASCGVVLIWTRHGA